MLRPSPDTESPPVSKTAQYKKITKPLLERKRRARMNRCYDDLKVRLSKRFELMILMLTLSGHYDGLPPLRGGEYF